MFCFYYRWKISQALDSAAKERLPERHLRGCPACRMFHQDAIRLGQRLRQELAATNVLAASKQGASSLAMEAFPPRAAQAPRGSAARTWRYPVAAALAAAALFAILVLVWPHLSPATSPQNGTPVVTDGPGTLPASSPTAAYASFSVDDLHTSLSNLADLASQPVTEGLQQTSSDVQAAGATLLSYFPAAQKPEKKDKVE